jgi:branched-subunit amino acid ABC-type transport system permease component
MDLNAFIQTLVYGLALGGTIAVGAVGLTLSYGVTRFINFAYGEFLTLGAYSAFAFVGLGLPLPLAAAVAVVLTGVAGVAIARAAFDPLMHRGLLPLLVTSVGVAFVLHNLVRMVAGANPLRFPVPLMRPWDVAGVFVPKEQVLTFLIALAAMAAVHLLLSRTMLGKTMRAVADDSALARASGVAAPRVLAATWFLSAAIGALGGVLLAVTQVTLAPDMGWRFLLVVFAAVLLGGIGSPYGAMLGGLIVGLGVELGASYVSADYAYAFAFVVLVAVLLLRPRGLMGGRG